MPERADTGLVIVMGRPTVFADWSASSCPTEEGPDSSISTGAVTIRQSSLDYCYRRCRSAPRSDTLHRRCEQTRPWPNAQYSRSQGVEVLIRPVCRIEGSSRRL